MLRTTVEELKELHKKEEYEHKFRMNNNNSFYSFNLNQTIKTIFQFDHLPFSNLVFNIAGNMQNAPKKPEFKIKLENE